jgi:hypothetical protein
MFHNCTEKRVVKTMEKNLGKLYILSMILILLASFASAKELSYDTGPPGSNCMMIGSGSTVIVRFTPDVSGPVENVRILWSNQCSQTSATSEFYVRICECDAENIYECYDSEPVTSTNIVSGGFQNISVSSLNFNATKGEDFCVQVDSKGSIYVARSGTGSNLDHYYNRGLFAPISHWYSFSALRTNFLPNIKELAIRAVISTPTTTTTTRVITTTTIPFRGGGGGGGGGGGISGVNLGNGSCFDGLKNQGETEVDCGGSCAPCPSCSDGIQNQGEIAVDCGGPCAACTTTTLLTSTTVATSTTTTTEIATTTTSAPEAPNITGLVTGAPLGGMSIFLFLLFLLLIVIYIYRGNILGGKK